MAFRTGINFFLFAIALVVVAIWASAQVLPQPPGETGLKPMDLVAPTVMSGSDLGFRIESYKDKIAVGKLVVRVKGVWIDAQVGSNGVVVAVPR